MWLSELGNIAYSMKLSSRNPQHHKTLGCNAHGLAVNSATGHIFTIDNDFRLTQYACPNLAKIADVEVPVTEINGNKSVTCMTASGHFLALATARTDNTGTRVDLFQTRQQLIHCDKHSFIITDPSRFNPVVAMVFRQYRNLNLLLAANQWTKLTCYAIARRQLLIISTINDSSATFDGKTGMASSVCMQGNRVLLLGKERRQVKLKLFKLQYVD